MTLRLLALRSLILLAFVAAATLPLHAGPFDATKVESVVTMAEDDDSAAVPADIEPVVATAAMRPRLTGAFLQLWESDL